MSQSTKFSNTNPLPSWGWKKIQSEIEFANLWDVIVDDPLTLLGKTMSLVSAVGKELGNKERWPIANVLSLVSEDMQKKFNNYFTYISAKQKSLEAGSMIAGIDEDGDLDLTWYSNMHLLKAVTGTTDKITSKNIYAELRGLYIRRIVEATQGPVTVYQYYDSEVYTKTFPKLDIDILVAENIGSIRCRFGTYLYSLNKEHSYYGEKPEVRHCLSSTESLTPILTELSKSICVSVSEHNCTLGRFGKTFGLDTFYDYVQDYTQEVYTALEDGPESLNVLCVGPHGTGKTEWCKAIGKELAKEGFAVFLVSPDYLEEFVPPSYLHKICIISNEVASFMRDRENAEASIAVRTSKMLSFLDGNAYSYVVPNNVEETAQRQIVKLLTCNSTNGVDPAALRKGRIDKRFEFTEPY